MTRVLRRQSKIRAVPVAKYFVWKPTEDLALLPCRVTPRV